MRHQIKSEDLRAPEMAEAIEKCVHCGFCLAACPTYNLLGEEMDSPRGRIYLMKGALEGRVSAADAEPYIDRCLGCMACVPACPSGVEYGDLLVSYRAMREKERERPAAEAMARRLIRETLPYPGRFRLAVKSGKVGRALRPMLPEAFASMLSMLPERLPPPLSCPPMLSAQGEVRGKVALLVGCVQQALAPEINLAAAKVLAANGVEVHIPAGQGCCGSILLHIGAEEEARRVARRNFSLMPDDVDAIITTAAGCGSGMRDYGLLFKGEADVWEARAFSDKALDFSAYLAGLGLREPRGFSEERVVVYQDACHLLHAQGEQQGPRDLLNRVANLRLAGVAEAGMCCGSAGVYNLEQPDIAEVLGQRKVEAILAARPDVVVSGNIGCITQLRRHLKARGEELPVLHMAELLLQAYA